MGEAESGVLKYLVVPYKKFRATTERQERRWSTMNDRSDNIEKRDKKEDQTGCPPRSLHHPESVGHITIQVCKAHAFRVYWLHWGLLALVMSRSSVMSQLKRTLDVLADGTQDRQRTKA